MATMISTYHMPPFMQLSIYKQVIICYLIVSNITNLKNFKKTIRNNFIYVYMYIISMVLNVRLLYYWHHIL